MKTLVITLTCLAAALGGFLTGDYHGLWKRSQINRLEIIPIRFKAMDSITQQPVDNYHLRCRSRESSDFCKPVAGVSEAPGVKTVRIAGQRRFETGLLDSITQQPVDNYHLRCRSRESSDFCKPVAGVSEAPGVKTVRIAGQRRFETGLLFNHDKGLVMEGPESIELWVIHPDYRTYNLETSYAELVSLGSDMKELILTPRVMAENLNP